MSIAISIEGLSKHYRLGTISHGVLFRDLQSAWARFRGTEDPNAQIGSVQAHKHKSFWALQDINFELKQGEVLGIVGRNGAGKSTLLKILSRVTAPTKGRAKIRGRLASLLEVGTGFHPELTGRENIFLNGAIMGMSRREVTAKLEAIIEFSGIEKFIDTPVKRYSSGMYVRLAFAVAAHLEPDILVVDEVLAVGDMDFQKKCLGKMQDVGSEGRTVIFVSHNMPAIRALCRKGIHLSHGRLEYIGDINEAITRYFDPEALDELNIRSLHGNFTILSAKILNAKDEESNAFQPGDSMVIRIKYLAKMPVKAPAFWISINSQFGPLTGANMLLDGFRPDLPAGEGEIVCRFDSLPLLPRQEYYLQLGCRAENGFDNLFPAADIGSFYIDGSAEALGMAGKEAEGLLSGSTPVILPYSWKVGSTRRQVDYLRRSVSHGRTNDT